MNKLFTKIATAIAGFAMVVGVGVGIGLNANKQANLVSANDATFLPADFSGQGTSGTGSAISATNDGVTFACDKGYGTTQIRCYSGSTITISSENTISNIAFTFSGSYTGGLETSYSDLSTTSWTKKTSSQARINSCTVTYSTGSGATQLSAPLLSYSDGSVTWDVVDGAVSYVARINNGTPIENATSPISTATFDVPGAYTISVVAKGNGTTTLDSQAGTVTFALLNKNGTENDPYDVANAIAAIDGQATTSEVYVSGVVSQVDSFNETYKTISYWISDDGTTSNQFKVFGGRNIGDTDFTSADNIELGANVTIKGNILKYSSYYEFDSNNILQSYSISAKRSVQNKLTVSSLSYRYTKSGELLTDTMTNSSIGVSGSSYSNWSGKSDVSDAVYAGNTSGGSLQSPKIQLRSSNSSGIITTTSGGTAKSVTVVWNSSNTNGRKFDIYGKNTAYSATSELYNNSNQGTKLGSITYGTNTSLTITGSYKFLGLRASDGAIYFDSISIEWDTTSYSYNSTIRFSGFINKALWSELDTNEHIIKGYGVLFATKDRLLEIDPNRDMTLREAYDSIAEPENETNFKDYNSDDIVPAKTTPTLFSAEDYPDALTEDTYIWNLCIKVANADLKKEFVASAYIVIDDGNGGTEKVHLQEVMVSAKSLAASMLPSAGNNAYEGSLKNLAELE